MHNIIKGLEISPTIYDHYKYQGITKYSFIENQNRLYIEVKYVQLQKPNQPDWLMDEDDWFSHPIYKTLFVDIPLTSHSSWFVFAAHRRFNDNNDYLSKTSYLFNNLYLKKFYLNT
jgi:hypothetical protein